MLSTVWDCRRLVVTTVGVLLSGCGCDMGGTDYTRTKPSTADLAGEWVAAGPGGTSAATVVLNPDGSFTASHFPPSAFAPFIVLAPTPLSGRGTWSVYPHQEWWAVNLTWDRASWDPISEPGASVGISAYVAGGKGRHRLRIELNGPDSGEAIVLDRKSPDANPTTRPAQAVGGRP